MTEAQEGKGSQSVSKILAGNSLCAQVTAVELWVAAQP